jgi:hypothetical protein
MFLKKPSKFEILKDTEIMLGVYRSKAPSSEIYCRFTGSCRFYSNTRGYSIGFGFLQSTGEG